MIYVNGCSFTNGIDVADYLLAGYPPELTFNQACSEINNGTMRAKVQSYYNWTSIEYDKIVEGTTQLNYAGYTNRQKRKLRWSAVLSDILDKEIIDNSSPGCDNYSIYIRTCNDVHDLRKQGIEVEKIIVQFTCRTRHAYIKEITPESEEIYGESYLNMNKIDDQFFVRSINHANINHPNYSTAEKYFLETDNSRALELDMPLTSRLLNYFSKLKMYKDAIHGATGIEPIIVDGLFLHMDLISSQGYDLLNGLDKDTYFSRIVSSVFPYGIDSMANMCHGDAVSLTSGMHFTKEVHELFAKHLAGKYFNE